MPNNFFENRPPKKRRHYNNNEDRNFHAAELLEFHCQELADL